MKREGKKNKRQSQAYSNLNTAQANAAMGGRMQNGMGGGMYGNFSGMGGNYNGMGMVHNGMGSGGDANGMQQQNPYASQFASNMMQNIMGLISQPHNNSNNRFHNMHTNFARRETAYSPPVEPTTEARLSIEAEDSSVEEL